MRVAYNYDAVLVKLTVVMHLLKCSSRDVTLYSSGKMQSYFHSLSIGCFLQLAIDLDPQFRDL